jgi:hypothetical protein
VIETSDWTYQGEKFDETLSEGYHGFVYIITNTLTGRKYIGKKSFWSTRRVKVKGKTRRKVKKSDSDWRDYFGSSEELLSDVEKAGSANFSREIMLLCQTKSDASYHEARLQFEYRVLESDDFYNAWIMVKVRKSHLARTLS